MDEPAREGQVMAQTQAPGAHVSSQTAVVIPAATDTPTGTLPAPVSLLRHRRPTRSLRDRPPAEQELFPVSDHHFRNWGPREKALQGGFHEP